MVTVVVATPLEPELVERLRHVDPRLEVLFEPDLLPPARYPCDHAGDPSFRRTAEQERRFEALLGRAEVLLGFPGEDPRQLAEALRSAPRLRFVQAMYAGAGQQVEMARLPRAELERIVWTSSSGVHATPLAEWSLLGILALTRELPRLLADQHERRWNRRPVEEVRGKTLLVVGLGAIGREVARLGEALGMHVLSLTRTSGDLDELLPQADAVVLTLPLTAETHGLLDRRRIGSMRRGSILVNVGRGAVLDEEALVDALRERRLLGAVLDVFVHEPLPPESPLWELDNVILSPHMAALSVHENERIVDLFADNLRRYLAGEELRSRIRTDLFY